MNVDHRMREKAKLGALATLLRPQSVVLLVNPLLILMDPWSLETNSREEPTMVI